jgi:eukaryotic-like serine/threonine-protein kinase
VANGARILPMAKAANDGHPQGLTPGALFADRYQVEELIGRGGMGAVYRARDLSLGETIALKVLGLGADAPPIAVLRFRQEVKLARRVTHPNVARVYDIGEHEGLFYLTMEFIEGSTLREILTREHRLSPGRAAAVGRVIASALHAAHIAGIVHRDIKPTNVIIDRTGKVVLTDFGIARKITEESELTVGVIGTPQYMAPEQVEGGPVDARTDLYALGLCLYEMLTGERASGKLANIARGLVRAGTPTELVKLTLSCIEHEPEVRPGSAAEVERALAAFVTFATDDTMVPAPPPTHTLALPLEAHPTAEDMQLPPPMSGVAPASSAVTPTPCLDADASAPPRAAKAGGAETSTRGHVVAILPFFHRGGPEAEDLAFALPDGVVDFIVRATKGGVLVARDGARYRTTGGLRLARDELGATAVLDGTVQLVGKHLRVTARIIDVVTQGTLASVMIEGMLGDLLTLESSITQRLSEQLRLELILLDYRDVASTEAEQLYRSARSRLRGFEYTTAAAAAKEFEQCLALSPQFVPALAGHAMAAARAWFFESGYASAPNWERVATTSVALALARAPHLPESHIAAGMVAIQSGEHAAAVRLMIKAIALAPASAEGYLFLGEIECETGQLSLGVQHLKQAINLAPDMSYALVALARHHALEGRYDVAEELLTRLDANGPDSATHGNMIRVRMAAFRGDREALRWFADGKHLKHTRAWELIHLYAQTALGDLGTEDVEQRFASLVGPVTNMRRATAGAQFLAEAFAARGDLEAATLQIFRAASIILIDMTWLDFCPLFRALRANPDFKAARSQVQTRVERIWHT